MGTFSAQRCSYDIVGGSTVYTCMYVYIQTSQVTCTHVYTVCTLYVSFSVERGMYVYMVYTPECVLHMYMYMHTNMYMYVYVYMYTTGYTYVHVCTQCIHYTYMWFNSMHTHKKIKDLTSSSQSCWACCSGVRSFSNCLIRSSNYKYKCTCTFTWRLYNVYTLYIHPSYTCTNYTCIYTWCTCILATN